MATTQIIIEDDKAGGTSLISFITEKKVTHYELKKNVARLIVTLVKLLIKNAK